MSALTHIERHSSPPLIRFDPICQDLANKKLIEWKHKMGVLHRGNQKAICHGLFEQDNLLGVTMASTLITPQAAGGLLLRSDTIELSRLCASRSELCRVILRLWREFVFPQLGYTFAMSYQDADLHTGNTYRFDGWKRIAHSNSGTDTRSGRTGRSKYLWVWPPTLPYLADWRL